MDINIFLTERGSENKKRDLPESSEWYVGKLRIFTGNMYLNMHFIAKNRQMIFGRGGVCILLDCPMIKRTCGLAIVWLYYFSFRLNR